MAALSPAGGRGSGLVMATTVPMTGSRWYAAFPLGAAAMSGPDGGPTNEVDGPARPEEIRLVDGQGPVVDDRLDRHVAGEDIVGNLR